MRRSQDERPLKIGWRNIGFCSLIMLLLIGPCYVLQYVKRYYLPKNSSTTLDKIYPTSSNTCLPISSYSHDESIGKRKTICRHHSCRTQSDKKAKIKVMKWVPKVFYVGASVFFFETESMLMKIGLHIYISVHIVFERMLRQNCSTSQCFQLLCFDNQYVSHK